MIQNIKKKNNKQAKQWQANAYENDPEFKENRIKYGKQWQANKYENDPEWVANRNKKQRDKYKQSRVKELLELGYTEEQANETIKSKTIPYKGYNERFAKKHIWEPVYDKYNYQKLDPVVYYQDNKNTRRHFTCDQLGLLREEIELNEDDEKEHEEYPIMADLCRECIIVNELLTYYDAAKMNRLNLHYKKFFSKMDKLARKLGSKFDDEHWKVVELENEMVESDVCKDFIKIFDSEVKYHNDNPIRSGWEKHYCGYSRDRVTEIKSEMKKRKDIFGDIDMEYAFKSDANKKANQERDLYHWKCNFIRK
eukprot:128967_1